jgi:hypothetical protein
MDTSRYCPHCRSTAARAHCVKCNREMCKNCISLGNLGDTCGLCKDREDGYRDWQAVGSPGDFDDWYDANC